MGNRAVIACGTNDNDVGVYLHWNGGRKSIDGFLAYCKAMRYRSPDRDCYGWACLVQTIRTWFGGDGLSCGIDTYDKLDTDNFDNGVYIINGWKVVDRKFNRREDPKTSLDELIEMITAINQEQPVHSQLTEIEIKNAAIDYLEQYNTPNSDKSDKPTKNGD